MFFKKIEVFLLALVYLIATAGHALAYLDPVTGTIIIQGLIAGGATVVVFFREKVFKIFKRSHKKNIPPIDQKNKEFLIFCGLCEVLIQDLLSSNYVVILRPHVGDILEL